MLNRHGLIAGATGTGKTKTLQLLAGQLSKAGVPGLRRRHQGRPDRAGGARRRDQPEGPRARGVDGLDVQAAGHPVEFLSLSGKLGAQVRATVHSFGPLLLGKVLDLNDTQTSILSLVFKYCDDNDLPLLDLQGPRDDAEVPRVGRGQADPRRLRRHVDRLGRGAAALDRRRSSRRARTSSSASRSSTSRTCCGRRPRARASSASSSCPTSWTSRACSRRSCSGCWPSSTRACPRPATCPSRSCASSSTRRTCSSTTRREALLDQVERTARLIRSKGVGVYFVTQAPTDVPSPVLAQLGNRVQHALRAFTPDDADALRKTARTFPMTDFYDVEKTITSLGTGEALVTVLSPQGVPTPLAATRLLAARLAHGADRRGPVPRPDRDEPAAGEVRRDRRPRQRLRADHRADRGAPGRPSATRRSGPASTRRPRPGMNTMTPAQQQREIARQQKAMEAAQAKAAGGRAPGTRRGEGRGATAARGPAEDDRHRDPDRRQGRDLAARPGHHPGLFGTLFGGGKSK